MEQLKQNTRYAKITMILIAVVAILNVIGIVFGNSNFYLLQSIKDGAEISAELIEQADMKQSFTSLVLLVTYIASVVAFLFWFYRAYKNLHIHVKILSYEKGWAIGAWFVPFLNLIRPFKIMKELYEESRLFVEKYNGDVNKTSDTIWLYYWWGLWVFNLFLNRYANKYDMRAETIIEMQKSELIGIGVNVIGIILSMITIKVIWDYSKAEKAYIDLAGRINLNEDEPQADDTSPENYDNNTNDLE